VRTGQAAIIQDRNAETVKQKEKIMAKTSMFQAIQTKYIGPSNVRGARVKAWAEAGSLTLSWDHALNVEENHAKAAQALADKFGWTGPRYGQLIGGALPNPSRGYAFVSVIG
jgi:hypothetical protein